MFRFPVEVRDSLLLQSVQKVTVSHWRPPRVRNTWRLSLNARLHYEEVKKKELFHMPSWHPKGQVYILSLTFTTSGNCQLTHALWHSECLHCTTGGVFLFLMILAIIQIISLNIICRLFSMTDTEYILCEGGTKLLSKNQLNVGHQISPCDTGVIRRGQVFVLLLRFKFIFISKYFYCLGRTEGQSDSEGGRNVGWGFSRIRCWGGYLGPRGMR
jgi:hypothetical protein